MVHFQVRGEYKVLSTNFKVMYRTFCLHDHLKEISAVDVLILRLKCLFLFRKCRHVLLVRNPYSRMISFFQDKFRYDLERGRKGRLYHNWMCPQKIFFPYVDVNKCDSYEIIRKKLSLFEFNELIELLPKVYRRDFHVMPQCHIKIKGKVLAILPLFFNEIIKIEDQEAVKRMAVEFNIDLTIKANATSKQNIEDWFNSETYVIMNRLYQQDFKFFKYQTAQG